ncbi:MAG: type II toxin-antitoxin system RelE/ParE family toxin [Cyanobacteria bacterium P01_C01_bin.70]
MSRVCRITPRASQDIEDITDYLATHSSLDRAETFLSGIDSVLQRIAQFPQIGRKRDELYPKSAELALQAIPDFLPFTG